MKTCSVIILVIFLAVLPTATFAESIPIQSDHIQTALSRASSCIVLNLSLIHIYFGMMRFLIWRRFHPTP